MTRDGVDLSPPLSTLLTRLVHEVVGPGHVTTRLPALAGYALMIACIFAFVRRRAGVAAATSAALIPYFTAAQRYASEARGYGLMIGFGALAFLCWADAARDRRRIWNLIALAVAVAASIWSHYYAVLVVVAIAAGELSRVVVRRRIDWAVIASVGAGAAATLPLLPLVRAAAGQRETFWANVPGPSAIGDAYQFLFQTFAEPVFLLAGVTVATAAVVQRWRSRDMAASGYEPVERHEMVAIALLALLPVAGYLLGSWVTGVFVQRYLLATVIGVAIAVSIAVARVGGPLPTLMMAMILVAFAAATARGVFANPAPTPNPFAARPLLIDTLRQATPTVVQANIHFLQLWYYAPPDLKVRMHYLVDTRESLARLGSDTIDRGYAGLAQCCALPADDAAEFLQRYPEFNLYTSGSNWLVAKLREDGTEVEERGREPGAVLMRVRRD